MRNLQRDLKHLLLYGALTLPYIVTAAPNIVVIVADDLGFMDIGYNNPAVYTPNLDRLAATGIRFDQHYVMSQCTPTRVALLTGRFPSRFGRQAQQATNAQTIPLGTPIMASMLKSVGYRTFLAGKWHLGSNPAVGPNHYGFDESYGSLAGASGAYDHRYRPGDAFEITWHRNHEIIPGYQNGEHFTDLVAREATRFIQRKHTTPFFLYLPFHAPHTPLDERGPFIDTPTQRDPAQTDRWLNEDHISWFNDPQGLIQAESDPEKRLFLAVVHHLDDAIGHIVDALDATGQRRNTLILFTSDNGPQINWPGNAYPDDLQLSNFNQPDDLRGSKTDIYEGGIRVPAFINWPAELSPRVHTDPLHAVDWFPTLAGLAGYTVPTWLDLDGRDVWATLSENSPAQTPLFHWIWGSGNARFALRSGDWKITRYGSADWMLFDIANDPNETSNLSGSETNRLTALLNLYDAEHAKDVVALQPSPELSGPTQVNGPFIVNLVFPQPVTGFEPNDIATDGVEATAVSGSGTTYRLSLLPTVSTEGAIMNVQIPGSPDTLPSNTLSVRFSNLPAGWPLGPFNRGMAAQEPPTDLGFALYSLESVHDRFSATPPHMYNADHLIIVRHNGSNWQFDDNVTWQTFTPTPNDLLVAELDLGADTVTLLEGANGITNGIPFGYAVGDLVIQPNRWNGGPNSNEFGLEGNFLQLHDGTLIGQTTISPPEAAAIFSPWATTSTPFNVDLDLGNATNALLQVDVMNGSLISISTSGVHRTAWIEPTSPGLIQLMFSADDVQWESDVGLQSNGYAEVHYNDFELWANALPADPDDVNARTRVADRDGDLRSNEREFLFGGDPTLTDQPPAGTLEILPNLITFNHFRRADAERWGIDYSLHTSTNLTTWLEADGQTTNGLNEIDYGDWGRFQQVRSELVGSNHLQRLYLRLSGE